MTPPIAQDAARARQLVRRRLSVSEDSVLKMIEEVRSDERERAAQRLDALADATPEHEAGYRAGVRDSAAAIRAPGRG